MIFITHTPRLSVSVATSAFFKAGWGGGGKGIGGRGAYVCPYIVV